VKVTALETLRLDDYPALVWLRVHTDEGVTGLGETCLGVQAVEAQLHEAVAPKLLGADPLQIDRVSRLLADDIVGIGGTGVATRANSAVDLALWDVLGQVCGQPVYQLLGGASRDRVPVYNTCAGASYGSTSANVDRAGNLAGPGRDGPMDDLAASTQAPAELAQSLLDEGITGMKIWPLDEFAVAGGGRDISTADLRRGLAPLAKIRDAVGDSMRIMLELHALWEPTAAAKIARAAEEYDPYWIEDPTKADDFAALARLAERTPVPLMLGETLGTRIDFRRLFESGAAGAVMFDPGWVGGISEARKIGAMAEAYRLTVSPHDCTGPVVLAAGVHLSANLTNGLFQEVVRAFYRGWYPEVVDGLPALADGAIAPSAAPGLGVSLRPGLESRPDAHVRVTRL
jgi:L-alanine-DL-glutamate epimerase-like enolase superfamily enzyme